MVGFRNPNCTEDRYSFILARDESGARKFLPYGDSKGIPTIGVGFNLRDPDNRSAIHSELGITDLNLRGALGAGALGGGLGYAGSIGAAHGAANLQTLQGL